MGVSTYVLRKWLKPLQPQLGTRKGYYYNVEQMIIIYAHLGLPLTLEQLQRVQDLPNLQELLNGYSPSCTHER